jgi:hypothetical protein
MGEQLEGSLENGDCSILGIPFSGFPAAPPMQVDEAALSLSENLEYLLRIEPHFDKYFDIRHKIAFFIITAAVGSIGYTLNFSVARLDEVTLFPERVACVTVGAILALLTVALVLLSIYYDSRSYANNLQALSERKLYDKLSSEQKESWKRVRVRATYCQRLAFTSLFLSASYQISLFLVLAVFQ